MTDKQAANVILFAGYPLIVLSFIAAMVWAVNDAKQWEKTHPPQPLPPGYVQQHDGYSY